MELAVTQEQAELRSVLRRFFADTSPGTEVRRLMETPEGHDRALWRRMGEELGLPGLAIPEEYGGAGYGFRELAVVMEELGRALVCAPYLSSAVLAAQALLLGSDEAVRKELLPGIAEGTRTAALAWAGEDGTWDAPAPVASAAGGTWALGGAAAYVLDGRTADVLLVVARAPGGPSLFEVAPDAPGLTRTPLPALDQTRRLARLEFSAVPARLLGAEGGAELAGVLDRAAVALAAEQLGGAQRVLEMSVEYAKVRRQFGRPIGSFQAIKHRCADLLVEVESSRSAVMAAAFAADADPAALPAAAALARAYVSEAYLHAAGETIQIHGGIGFTWEHDAHLYFKRAHGSRQFLGDPGTWRARLGGLVL